MCGSGHIRGTSGDGVRLSLVHVSVLMRSPRPRLRRRHVGRRAREFSARSATLERWPELLPFGVQAGGNRSAGWRDRMHDYPLHRPVQAPCLCCQVESDFRFTSAHNQVVCRGCERHQGDSVSKAIQRDRDHVTLWRSELAVHEEDAAERESSLRRSVADREAALAQCRVENRDLRETVRRGFEEAPLPAVERWLVGEEIQEASRRRDAAYRSRDYAFQLIWALARLHGPDDNRASFCRCGSVLGRCSEGRALAPGMEMLRRWEAQQIDRLDRGLECGLPDDHPEVRKRGCRPRRWWQTG